MKLTTVKSSDFKCICETCQIEVSDITFSVGKNRSGKAAILEALYCLKQIVPQHGSFNVDDDFPGFDMEGLLKKARMNCQSLKKLVRYFMVTKLATIQGTVRDAKRDPHMS